MPQYPIFSRPKMKICSPFPPQSSSPSRIALKDIDNLVEELEYNKDYNNGCFNEDDLGKSDFTEAGLIDEMEYIKDFNNGCFNEDTGELYEEAVYEKAVYEEAIYDEEDTGELNVCEEEQGYDDSGGQEQDFGGHEQDFGGHEQDFGGHEQDFGGHEQDFGGQEQEYVGQEQEFVGQEQEFVGQEQDCDYIDEYNDEYSYEQYCGDEVTGDGFYY